MFGLGAIELVVIAVVVVAAFAYFGSGRPPK